MKKTVSKSRLNHGWKGKNRQRLMILSGFKDSIGYLMERIAVGLE